MEHQATEPKPITASTIQPCEYCGRNAVYKVRGEMDEYLYPQCNYCGEVLCWDCADEHECPGS